MGKPDPDSMALFDHASSVIVPEERFVTNVHERTINDECLKGTGAMGTAPRRR
jgi:hypothetical protein